MQKWPWLLVAAFIFSHVKAQQTEYTVSGKIIDKAAQTPLTGASVFCQNTTLGAVSNSDGQFTLRVPAGGYDLIVSYTGYETYSTRINREQSGVPLIIELKKQDKSLQEVAVVGSNEVADGWNKYGQFFLENFIGTTPNARDCHLENADSLRFFYSKKRNRLKILSRSDLVMVNDALGYKIRYQMDSFVHEYGNGISTFSGYPLYEEMQGSAEQVSTWKANRSKAYSGSRLHFMRSWYDSSLTAQGFTIEQVKNDHVDGIPVANPYDTSFYHADSSDVEIDLKGRLRITYHGKHPDPEYLAAYKLPAQTRVQISAIDVADVFIIERNGYFYEQSDVVNIGYWAWKKLADALPYDYRPE